MRSSRLICAGCAVVALLAPAALLARTLPKPLFTIVYLRRGDRSIAGHLVTYNHRRLVILMANHKRTHLRWSALTPSSAFNLRARLINQKSAADWLKLGEFGWKLDVKRLARNALNRAAAMNPALRHKVNKILLTTPGQGSRRGAAGAFAGAHSAHRRRAHRRDGRARGALYRPASATAARQRAQIAQAIANHFNVRPYRYHLRDIKTKHFMIFTDWNTTDRAGLAGKLEGVYHIMARILNVPRHAPVFVGKFPIFITISTSETARIQAYAVRKYHFTAETAFAAGVTMTNPNRGIAVCERANPSINFLIWGRVIDARTYQQHVFALQVAREFLMRYGSTRPFRGWFRSGLTRAIANTACGVRWNAYYAWKNLPAADIIPMLRKKFDRSNDFSLAESAVDALLVRNRTAFKRFMLDQKKGLTLQHALRKEYHMDYRQLASWWRICRARVLAPGPPSR